MRRYPGRKHYRLSLPPAKTWEGITQTKIYAMIDKMIRLPQRFQWYPIGKYPKIKEMRSRR